MKETSLSELHPDEIKKAIANCLEQIANSPQPAKVYLNLGDLYAQQEQWQSAMDGYRQATVIKPDFAAAYFRLAKIATQIGDDNQAADYLYQGLQLKPDAGKAQRHYKLGQTLISQNKPAKAIACYRTAIRVQPDFWLAYETLATLLAQQGKNEPALEVYRQGVKNNPDNAQYYFALAEALAARKQWVRASNNYQKAAELESSGEIYARWGEVLYQLQEYTSAQECYQKAAELSPSAEIYYYWGEALYQLQEYSLASECYHKAIAFQANYWQAYYQLGLIWQQQQQWHKSLIAYTKVREIQPECVEVLVDLGLVYRRLQQYDSAIACYREVINRSPENPSLATAAIEGYQTTLTEHPQATVILYYQLAKLLRSKSYFPQAIAAYQQSIQLDPYFKDAYIALQYTPIAAQQLDDLITFYRQIVAKHPDITIAWGNLGDALTQKDRVEEAIDCYRTGCYQQAIQNYPYLAKLTWKKTKTSAPDFIIAGASKCGTSSLYHYLGRHPQILLSHIKEIDFYWKHFERGIDWYLAHFPTLTDREDFLTGEATPNYLRFPQVAQRIKDTFPQVKIILLLRNPADRAISWHYHKLNTGLTNQDLTTAIAEEIARLATVKETEIINTGFYNPDNILSSLYIYKIKPWIELLGREQFLILKSEELYGNPLKTTSEVFNFLGLPNCTLDNYPKVNAGFYNQVDLKLRETLVDYFTPYNQQLEDYLSIKFSWQ
ncbi:MAG: tetratricopeptide repeat protein [Waterburya sp.]